jgi:hypothetical protein
MRRLLRVVPLLALGLGLPACVGARTTVMAKRAEVPVSMSRALRDADGSLVTADRRTVVGTFTTERTAWNILWAAIKVTPETDISDAVNEQVAAVKGDAITHLTVVTKHCALNYFVFPFGLLPFWPSCADLVITGQIVKVGPAPRKVSAEPKAEPQKKAER